MTYSNERALAEASASNVSADFVGQLANFRLHGELPHRNRTAAPRLPASVDKVTLLCASTGEELAIVERLPKDEGFSTDDILSALWLHKDLAGVTWMCSDLVRSEPRHVTFGVRLSGPGRTG